MNEQQLCLWFDSWGDVAMLKRERPEKVRLARGERESREERKQQLGFGKTKLF